MMPDPLSGLLSSVSEDTHQLIDSTTPEALEQFFNAWLKGGSAHAQLRPIKEEAASPLSVHSNGARSWRSSEGSSSVNSSLDDCSANGSPPSYLCMDVKAEPNPDRPNYPIGTATRIQMGEESGLMAGCSFQYAATLKQEMGVPDMDYAYMQINRNSGTNQLGRTYNPGLPLSMEEREKIVELAQRGWKICNISKRLCVTHSCVSKILNRYRKTGSCRPKDAKEGRTESPMVKAIRLYVTRLGLIRQAEIRERLVDDGICTVETLPSRSSINHILRTKLAIKTRRKLSD